MGLRGVVVLVCAGCGSGGLGASVPELVSTSVDGVPVEVSPTGVIELRFSSPIDRESVSSESVLLIEGEVNGPFQGGANHPLKKEERQRLVPGAVEGDGAVVHFQPTRPLAPRTLHTVLATTLLRSGGMRPLRAATRIFLTGGAEIGAPTWTLCDPEEGSVDVVRNLRAVQVRFSRPVSGVDARSLQLFDAAQPLAATISAQDGNTFSIWPVAPLPEERTIAVIARLPIMDEAGESPFRYAKPPSFQTGQQLRIHSPRAHEVALVASSGCLIANFETDVAASARLCVGSLCQDEAVRGFVHQLSVPLLEGDASASLHLSDESTVPESTLGPLAVPAFSSRTLTITEVLSKPRTGTLVQQFVEIQNTGREAVDLGGLELADERGASRIPSAMLEPGQLALIVPKDFLEHDGVDIPPASGTKLIRVGERHLGGNGIRESGEELELREPDGRRVSRFSTVGIKLATGQSAQRAAACDIEAAYRASFGGANPGEL